MKHTLSSTDLHVFGTNREGQRFRASCGTHDDQGRFAVQTNTSGPQIFEQWSRGGNANTLFCMNEKSNHALIQHGTDGFRGQIVLCEDRGVLEQAVELQ